LHNISLCHKHKAVVYRQHARRRQCNNRRNRRR
jgi:hypothetical protein